MSDTFETQMQELERIVTELEKGDLTLEESLAMFERGVLISRECRDRLTSAERRIEVLMKDGDGRLGLTDLGHEPQADD